MPKKAGLSFLGILPLLLLILVVQVRANTVVYGDLVGIRLRYVGLQETAMTQGDTAPLYGNPTLSGDSLLFNSMSFSSQASNGGTDITDGKLDGTIESKNNDAFYIDKLRFREFGDTTLVGTGTAATRSSVGNTLFLTVTEVDNVTLDFPEMFSVTMTLSPTSQWTLAGGPITGLAWSGATDVDLTALLAADGIDGHATRVTFSMDNTLTTSSEDGTSAYIAKKAAGLSVTPVLIDVPEPSTLSLLVLGGLLFLRKRR